MLGLDLREVGRSRNLPVVELGPSSEGPPNPQPELLHAENKIGRTHRDIVVQWGQVHISYVLTHRSR